MAILFKTTDPRGLTVTCSEERWQAHVLDQRPWMAGWESLVQKAIENPTLGIFKDAQFPNRDVYYYIPSPRTRYLKVIVQFDGDEGVVVTAIPTNSPKDGEVWIWPPSSH